MDEIIPGQYQASVYDSQPGADLDVVVDPTAGALTNPAFVDWLLGEPPPN